MEAFLIVPYVFNGYIIREIQKSDVKTMEIFLIALPRCPYRHKNVMMITLNRLKATYSKLQKSGEKAAGKKALEDFLAKEFVFPLEEGPTSGRYIFVKSWLVFIFQF